MPDQGKNTGALRDEEHLHGKRDGGRPVVANGPGDPHPHNGDASVPTDDLRLSSTNPQNEQLVLKG